ncbi:MAG: ABC transporter ATP-binding protein/permease, partial [Clostridiales bacterium]|nr:ABC transporter ATP-binding protein/permease [Clostridiales bacterium]
NKIMYSSENKMIVDDALDRINSILNMKPIEEAKKPQCPKNNGILLKDVKFRYKNDSPNAIDGISLKINPGEHVAFVGPSGGGKSTLAGIIAGFWRPNEGEIIIGGINSENIKSNDLMNTVSFVFQDSKLIKSSIYENIKMGNPKASRQEIFQAINDAQCGDIIEKLPDGADTVVGSKGVYLSGGEAQRISIARAMLKNAPIIILDEATAFADPDNEIRVQQAFSKLSKGKTVIMIAHRLSTVTSADKIFVIKDGKINSYGTHNELLSKKGIYYEMWKEYSKSAKWKVGDLNA